MESQINMESQTNIESQIDTLSSPILTNVLTVKVPDGFDKKKLGDDIIKLIENTEREEKLKTKILLFKNKTANNILCDLENGATPEYVDNIIKSSDEYKNNSVINLIVNYYAYHFNMKIEDLIGIFTLQDTRILLGLLLRIPVHILIKMSNEKKPVFWIVNELEYYKNSGNIRIDEICKNVDLKTYNHIVVDYLLMNHIDLLLEYNKLSSATHIAKKMTEMKKDLLKI